MDRGAWQATLHRVAGLYTTEATWHAHTYDINDTYKIPAVWVIHSNNKNK